MLATNIMKAIYYSSFYYFIIDSLQVLLAENQNFSRYRFKICCTYPKTRSILLNNLLNKFKDISL